MNLRDLRYFLAVVDLGHFSQAAEQCHVSQPTLSGQIKKLEETLGVQLFERTNRRVMVTEAGEQIALATRRALQEVDRIHGIAQSLQAPLSGKFRLGAFPTLASYLYPKLIPQIKANLPDLYLILLEEKSSQLLSKLNNGDIDAAFLALPVEDDLLVSHALFDDEFLLAMPAGHPLSTQKQLDVSRLHDYDLLLLEEGHCLRNQALDICHSQGIQEKQDVRATSLETLRQMVKAGTGITLMPQVAISEDEPGITYQHFPSPPPSRTIGLVWRKTSTKQAILDKLTQLDYN